MLTLLAFIRRNPALSLSAFRHYWVHTHVPLIRDRLPQLVAYRGYLPPDADEAERLGADAVVLLGFADRQTMLAAMSGPVFDAPDRIESSRHLLDVDFVRNHLLEEIDFLAHREPPIVSNPNSVY